MSDKINSIQIARDILSKLPVFLDTETTGLGNQDEICEISVVDSFGKVLFGTYVKPTIPMKPDAEAIHGISDEMLEHAPTFDQVYYDLRDVLSDKCVVIYNAEYDVRMIRQSIRPYQDKGFEQIFFHDVHCAMRLYAQYYGEWDDYRQSYKWQRLANAMHQQGIQFSGKLHSALADAELTRQLLYKMAGDKK